MNNKWEYYNHALVPTTAPHVEPDISWVKNKKTWKKFSDGRYPLFVRWITDFDCAQEILHDNKETSMRIPMLPGTRSLNLSNSVAIVVYEALRQNGFSNMELTGHLRNYDWD